MVRPRRRSTRAGSPATSRRSSDRAARSVTKRSAHELRRRAMTLGARFTKWGLGLFIFGVFLVFGIIGHYCGGARWPTGEQFLKNSTLWYACPWTLSVAAVQAGGLGIVGLGLAQITAAGGLREGFWCTTGEL